MDNSERVAHFLQAWREDYIYQTLAGAAMSFGITVLFALYHGYLGLRYGSVWHGSIGIFYLLLMVIRGSILLTEKRNQVRAQAAQHACRQRTFLISSILLLVLDLALIAPISSASAVFQRSKYAARPVSVKYSFAVLTTYLTPSNAAG